MKNYINNIFSKKNEINAGWAFFAFAVYHIGCFVGSILANFVVVVIALLLNQDRTTSLDLATFHYYQTAFLRPMLLFDNIIGLLFFVIVARHIFSNLLKDRSTIGAAWVSGSTKNIFIGIFLGVVFAITFIYIHNVFYSNSPHAMNFWQFMTEEKRAYFRIILIIVLIDSSILSPIIEELMFRGIILAGFNKSFGIIWGCILTTMFFILIHGSKLGKLDFLITTLFISIVLLLIRIRTSAVGPAIAFHISYNLVNCIYM